jgi:tetratricopeptide (TPR) repeat protein
LISTSKKRSRKLRANTPSTSQAAPLILVGVLAFALRVITALFIGKLPISRTPQYDALEYLLSAQRIAAGDFAWPMNPPHGPAYPYFLGALIYAGGGSLMFARLAQSIVGAATCCIAGAIAERLFGLRPGIVTAALLAIYGPLVWLDVSIASEGLLMFLLAAALWSAVSDRSAIMTGALAGLAALTRPTALIVLPLLMWMTRGRSRRAPLLMLAAAIVMIVPVTIANWRTSHAFIPIQAFGGMNVYLGNSPLRDGTASARPGGEWEHIEAEAVRNGAASLGAEDAYFMRKTLREIAAHPGAFFRLLSRKALLTFQNEEVRDTHSFYFFQQMVLILRWLPGFTLLFAFAVAGAVTADWRDHRVHIVAIYTALTALTSIFLVVGARYRIPVTLGLALFGGSVAVRSRRQLAVGAVAAVISAACTRIERLPATHNFAEEWALSAQSLLKEGELTPADTAAQRAAKIDPTSALVWDTRGAVYAASGRKGEAVEAFRRAIALNREFAKAHLHLAMLLGPDGNLEAAAAEYRQVIAIDPRNVEALWALARLDGALGKPAEGLDAARRAAAIKPPDDDDWLIIAMLAADLRQLDVAEDALAHIVEPSPRVEAAREAIRKAR